jgi:hypothetical protein
MSRHLPRHRGHATWTTPETVTGAHERAREPVGDGRRAAAAATVAEAVVVLTSGLGGTPGRGRPVQATTPGTQWRQQVARGFEVIKTVVIDAPRAKVWDALTNPATP